MALAAILDLTHGGHLGYWFKMMLNRQTDVKIEILVLDLVEKVFSYMILGGLVVKLIFRSCAWRLSWILGENDFIT